MDLNRFLMSVTVMCKCAAGLRLEVTRQQAAGISLSVDLRSRYEQYAGHREPGHNSCKFLSLAFSAFANPNLQRWTMPNNETAEYCLAAIMPIISNGGEQLDEDSDYEYGIV